MADERKGQSSLGSTLPSTGQPQERQGQSNAGLGAASMPDMRTLTPGRTSNASQGFQRVSDLGKEEIRGSGSISAVTTTAIPHDPLGEVDRVASAIKELIKDHFRVRREPGQTVPPVEMNRLTSGILYGLQQALSIVGGHPAEAQLAGELGLHLNRGEIDEANAKVDAL